MFALSTFLALSPLLFRFLVCPLSVAFVSAGERLPLDFTVLPKTIARCTLATLTQKLKWGPIPLSCPDGHPNLLELRICLAKQSPLIVPLGGGGASPQFCLISARTVEFEAGLCFL